MQSGGAAYRSSSRCGTRLACMDTSVLPRGEGPAREACCCSTRNASVELGRASGSAERQSLIRTAISSGHSSGTLRPTPAPQLSGLPHMKLLVPQAACQASCMVRRSMLHPRHRRTHCENYGFLSCLCAQMNAYAAANAAHDGHIAWRSQCTPVALRMWMSPNMSPERTMAAGTACGRAARR